MDPDGATTAEMMSVSTGLQLLRKAGVNDAEVEVVNDNTDTIKAINSSPQFRGLNRCNGWARGRLWGEVSKFENCRAEWSKDDSERSSEE